MSWPPEGLLLVDKPTGPTSHDVVDRVRRVLGQSRVGHTGTLDPAASGLLPLVLGRATRLARFLPHSPKTYEGILRLGLTTSTDDETGKVLGRHEGVLPSREAVLAAAAGLRGRMPQVPPAVSARKVGGRRLYRLAREGRVVQAPATIAEVFRLDLLPTERAEDWAFVAEVSAGTYIRALARDLGEALGCGGILLQLRRLGIGALNVTSALNLTTSDAEVRESSLAATIGLDEMPLEPPQARLGNWTAARRFVAGHAVPAPCEIPAEGACIVFDPDGRLLGVAESDLGELRPKVVLSPAPGSVPRSPFLGTVPRRLS